MSITLHLPDESELEAELNANAEDAAAAQEADEAAVAVEEGDEIEEDCESLMDSDASDPVPEGSLGDNADDPEATLLEEPACEQPNEPAKDAEAKTELPAGCWTHPSPSPTALARRPASPAVSPLSLFESNRESAVDEYVGATLECQKLEEAYKRAKKRMEAARDALVEIENERPDEDEIAGEFGTVGGVLTEAFSAAADIERQTPLTAGDPGNQAAATSPFPPPLSSAWRSTPIAALLLPASTAAKLIGEGYDTLGKLEDLRADTFAGGLKSIKGIGQKKADTIEEEILDWLSKNRDSDVLAAVRAGGGGDAAEAFVEMEGEPEDEPEGKPESAAPAAPTEAIGEVTGDTAAAAEENSEIADDETSVAPTPMQDGGTDDSTDDSRRYATIEARAQSIFFRTGEFSGVSDDEALNPVIKNAHCWESGEEAYGKGYDLIDCPWLPGVERDDWLRGWLSAKLTNEEGWEGPGTEGGAT